MAVRLSGVAMGLMLLLGAEARAEGISVTAGSRVEAGWASNALEGPVAIPDFFSVQAHELAIAGQGEGMVLRGTLSVVQTRFAVLDFADDDAVSGEAEAVLALGEGAALRLGYSGSHERIGDHLVLGDLVAGLGRTLTRNEVGAELSVSAGPVMIAAGLARESVRHGEAVLAGLGLMLGRLFADSDVTALRLGIERALGPALAVSAEALVTLVHISEADRAVFGRLPARGLRLAGAVMAGEGARVALGADFAWAAGAEGVAAPFVSLGYEIALSEALRLSIAAEAGVGLADPVDGRAGWSRSFGLGLRQALAPGLSLLGELEVSRETGLYDPARFLEARRATLGIAYAVGERVELGARLAWADQSEPGLGHRGVRLALGVSGRL